MSAKICDYNTSSNPIHGIMNAKILTEPNFIDWLRNLNFSTRAIEYTDCLRREPLEGKILNPLSW